ncbi:hypothetical protein SBV1_690025 [Verrucomicrobia bacterium]|nr:hypothetical protein SBV1_690025 [Verrucomicrobiota bacterium]
MLNQSEIAKAVSGSQRSSVMAGLPLRMLGVSEFVAGIEGRGQFLVGFCQKKYWRHPPLFCDSDASYFYEK